MGSCFLPVVFFFCGVSYTNGITDSVNCYHCGSETDSGWDLPCEKFNYQSLFEDPCSYDQFCFKTVSNTGHIVRGCAAKRTAADSEMHTTGCYKTPESLLTNITIMCFCDTPLCNTSSVSGFSSNCFILLYIFIYFLCS